MAAPPTEHRLAHLAWFVAIVFALTLLVTGYWVVAGSVAAVAAGLELSGARNL